MKAAVCREHKQPLKIEEVRLSPAVGNRLVVKLKACAICHSDIALLDALWGQKAPAIFGHEASGIVTEVGPDCKFSVGDHVIVTLLKSCGDCHPCNDDDPSSCHHAWDAPETVIFDVNDQPIAQGICTAAFAEYVNVDPSQCHIIPKSMGFDVASLLSCGVITGVGAVKNTAKLRAGQSCIVMGAGGVGLNAIQGAKLCGATTIIAMDVNEQKKAGALEFGATHFVTVGENALTEVQALTGGIGVDHVFVATGAGSAYQSAAAFLAPRGSLVMIGMPASGTMVDYDPSMIAAMNQKMLGSRMGQTNLSRDIPWLIEAYQKGELALDELISNRFPFDQINDAIADTRKGQAKRNVVVFS